MKNNILIAEFIGMVKNKTRYNLMNPINLYALDRTKTSCILEGFRFNLSWDWLIPVIKKIREIVNVKFSMNDFESFKEKELNLSPYDYNIEQVYKSVIEFIKWYNTLTYTTLKQL